MSKLFVNSSCNIFLCFTFEAYAIFFVSFHSAYIALISWDICSVKDFSLNKYMLDRPMRPPNHF